jgi:Ca2+-binding RTX toxin-like protein
MAGSFSFSSDYFGTFDILSQTKLSTGGPGGQINNPAHFSAIAAGQAIDFSDDRDIFAMAMTDGQSFTFDIDFAANFGNHVDVEIDIVDSSGNLVATNDDGGVLDPGSSSPLDPLFTFTASQTGLYFVVVKHAPNDYLDGRFDFDNGGSGTGNYQLNVSTAALPPLTVLSNSADTVTFGGAANRVEGRGGNDRLDMGGGDDIANGGNGNDRIWGRSGDDQLLGGAGHDRLFGNGGNDVLVGGNGDDLLRGEGGADDLMGGSGWDELYGGGGNDVLWGEGGADDLWGGGGNDEFVFTDVADSTYWDPDFIGDFNYVTGNNDVVNLAGVYDGKLDFIGTSQFNCRAGELRDVNLGGGLRELQVDVDGDGCADMAILVQFDYTFIASDFVL